MEEFTLGREQKYKESIAESKKKLLQNQRVVEVAAAEQNVALPYTIVDVSTIPHDVDPEKLASKPKAPTSDPPVHPATVPRRAKPAPSTLMGHSTTPSPAKRKNVDTKNNDAASQGKPETATYEDKVSKEQNDDKKKTAPMPTILYDDDHNRKDKVMSPNSQRKVAILIPSAPFPVSHIYEDIDDDTNTLEKEKGKITSGSDAKEIVSAPIRLGDSNKFDANMQAIAKNLDLKREKSQNEKEEMTSSDISETKPDKSKKPASGGKGFLSRFFSKVEKKEETEADSAPTAADKQISVIVKDVTWTRSQSVDCENTRKSSAAETGIESPVNRVRKTVMRSESTKEQSALQSELKTMFVKGVTKEESSSDKSTPGYQNAVIKPLSKDNVKEVDKTKVTKSPAKGTSEGTKSTNIETKLSKKPDIAGKPDKLKKPDKPKKPETPPCDKKISVVIDKPSAVVKPQVSPPKPLSPVKPKPTRKAKSVGEDKTNDGILTCDTSEKFTVPESPISPG